MPEGARLFLTAVGDFSASESTSDALPLGAAGDLAAPPSTQAFEARVELGGARFHGYAERTTSPELPILLWPEGSACRVRGAADYPAPGGGQAVGFDPASRTALVVGGGSVELPSASVAALAFDTGTGAIRSDASPEASLREPRAHASVTPFGSGLLVAGGENPVHGDAGALAQPRDTAERFDPASGRFTGSVALVEPRARHAAVVLASGETLLVGGRGALGAALRVLEVVSPGSMTGSIAGLPALRAPRLSPSAFLLDDGRLFVGGGTSADGAPLSALEWLSGDAREHLAADLAPTIPPRYDRAFAPLPGGGVLAVGGCDDRAPRDDDEAERCASLCNHGCPPADGYDAHWIAPDGAITAVPLDIVAPRPVLLGAGRGAPLLASGAPGDERLYRFDPWQARFEALPIALPVPPRAGLPVLALDGNAFLWLAESEDGPEIFGLRLDTRGRYARDVFLVAQPDPVDPARPLHLVPDRPVGAEVQYDGALTLEPNSEVTVYVTDTDYADVTITLTLEGEGRPRVVLGPFEAGGPDCPWPEGASSEVRVERTGSEVALVVASHRIACPAPRGRVRLGLRGGDEATRVVRLEVNRGTP